MNKYLTLDSSKSNHDETINYWYGEVVEPITKSLDSVTIGDLLNNENEGYNKIILLDIHQRIIELNNQPWNDDLFPQLATLLEQVTILQCERIYRYFMNGYENEVKEKYPNLVATGMFHLISIYGWLLPYFMDKEYYKAELDSLPPLPANLRPNSNNELIHPFALHYAHSFLAVYEKTYLQITMNDLIESHTPAHKKAVEKRQIIYQEQTAKLFQLLDNALPTLEKEGVKSTKKQALKLFIKHGNKLGYELSTLENRINEYKKMKKPNH